MVLSRLSVQRNNNQKCCLPVISTRYEELRHIDNRADPANVEGCIIYGVSRLSDYDFNFPIVGTGHNSGSIRKRERDERQYPLRHTSVRLETTKDFVSSQRAARTARRGERHSQNQIF